MTDDLLHRAAAELSSRQIQEMLVLIRPLDGDHDPINDLAQDDRSAFVSRIATALPDLERVIAFAFREQLEDLGMRAENEPQMFGGRGGLNMAKVLIDRFRGYRDEHLQAIADQRESENPQPGPVPSIEQGVT